jgi:DNA-binding transcriptional regulator YiaG
MRLTLLNAELKGGMNIYFKTKAGRPSFSTTCYKGANVKNKQLVELGKKIKALRKARKMSQETLAFDSNIDR